MTLQNPTLRRLATVLCPILLLQNDLENNCVGLEQINQIVAIAKNDNQKMRERIFDNFFAQDQFRYKSNYRTENNFMTMLRKVAKSSQQKLLLEKLAAIPTRYDEVNAASTVAINLQEIKQELLKNAPEAEVGKDIADIINILSVNSGNNTISIDASLFRFVMQEFKAEDNHAFYGAMMGHFSKHTKKFLLKGICGTKEVMSNGAVCVAVPRPMP